MKNYSVQHIIENIQNFLFAFGQRIPWKKVHSKTFLFFFILAILYTISSFLSSFFCSHIGMNTLLKQKDEGFFVEESTPPRFRDKEILERNIFNVRGDLPPEDTGDEDISDISQLACTQEPLPSALKPLGILFTGNQSTSLVTIRDAKAKTADVYSVGESIIDYNEYQIYKVSSPTDFELRKGNKKVCVNIITNKAFLGKNPLKSFKSSVPDISTYELSNSFVNEQIGKGYSKILTSAQLVPMTTADGLFSGYRVQNIVPESLFDTIGLVNGDILERVNAVSLKDPTKGFALYEALQNERQIVIELNRDGRTLMKKVYVK